MDENIAKGYRERLRKPSLYLVLKQLVFFLFSSRTPWNFILHTYWCFSWWRSANEYVECGLSACHSVPQRLCDILGPADPLVPGKLKVTCAANMSERRTGESGGGQEAAVHLTSWKRKHRETDHKVLWMWQSSGGWALWIVGCILKRCHLSWIKSESTSSGRHSNLFELFLLFVNTALLLVFYKTIHRHSFLTMSQ